MAKTVDRFKVFTTLDIFVQKMLKDSINYLTNTFNQSLDVFTTASPFGQTIIVLENISQLIFYYIEDSITELSIIDATRISSIYSLGTLAGHNPSRAVAATGEVALSTNDASSEATFDVVVIPDLTRVRCLNNGLEYVIKIPQDSIKFSMKGKDNGTRLNVSQGVIESQTVVSKGKPLESFSISSPKNYFIDNFFVNVYVNGERWNKYNSIIDMPRLDKGFLIKTGITNGIDLFFGNKFYGDIPPAGAEIIVEYLVNDGIAGNITTNNTNQIRFEFVDTGFTLLGEEVDLNEYVSLETKNVPNFGANPEDTELTRLLAPRMSKSFALVNIDHYEAVLRRLRLFSMINIFLDENDSRMLNLFLIPDINKLFNTGQDYFSVDEKKFLLSDFQKSELLRYIEKTGSKLISTDLKIINPVITQYVINTSVIVFDDIATDIVQRDIYNALGSYFIRNTRRTRIPKSDLIKLIEEVAGVDSVAITIVGENNETSKKINPNAAEVGLDEFNDIIIANYELPIISGGWTDRYGNEYSEGISEESLGSVNIQIKEIVPRPKILSN